jgi:hypothetical protein
MHDAAVVRAASVVSLLAALLAGATPALADPVALQDRLPIIAGSLEMTQFGEVRFEFVTPTFRADGILPDDENFALTIRYSSPAPNEIFAAPGRLVNLSSRLSLPAYDSSGGSVGDLIFDLDMTFTAAFARLNGSLLARAPFAAAGTLNVVEAEHGGSRQFNLAGRGRAALHYDICMADPDTGPCRPQIDRRTYQFTDTRSAPVPEPTSVVLLATGLVGSAWERLRAQRRQALVRAEHHSPLSG